MLLDSRNIFQDIHISLKEKFLVLSEA